MILKKVSLKPFAGVRDRQVVFSQGLNVVLGPNEAGKSTLFHSLYHALFTPVDLNKKDTAAKIARFIPLGGNTARLEMEWTDNDVEYHLSKSWGETRSAELTAGQGAIITGSAAVQEKILSLLPAGEGTYRSILLTRQSGLPSTLTELREDPEPVRHLGDILRRSIMNTDGVSLDRLRDLLTARIEHYFARWDSRQQAPEGNRGIHNPWAKGAGLIVNAWYEKERLQAALEDARRTDQALDEKNQALRSLLQKMQEDQEWIARYQPAIQDAQQRRILTAELENIQLRLKECVEDTRQWPVLENDLRQKSERLPALQSALQECEAEQAAAGAREQQAAQINKAGRVRELQARLEASQAALQACREVRQEDLDTLQDILQEINSLETRLKSGSISLTVTARTDLHYQVKKGDGEDSNESLQAEQSARYQSESCIRLEHPDWTIAVSAGTEDLSSLEQDLAGQKEALAGLYRSLGLADLDAVREARRAWQDQAAEVQFAQRALAEELGDDSLKELLALSEQQPNTPALRPTADITRDIIRLTTEINQLTADIRSIESKLSELTTRYVSYDELAGTKMVKLYSDKSDCEKQFKSLQPLPEGVDDLEGFLSEHKDRQAGLEAAKERTHALQIEILTLQQSMPDATVEELEEQVREKQAVFQAVLRKGESLSRIQEAVRGLLDRMDSGTYSGMESRLREYLGGLTAGRYGEVSLEDGLPRSLTAPGGASLPYGLLSEGAQDSLALALRLTLAEYFLGDSGGFLVLDDPLVDLDPERRARAIEALQRFAEKRQLILFTCHPHHAAELGGQLIELEGRV